ncbi:MAG: tRNA (adenosine(37)-N6)-threonylcarbamoyltransferase complex transferase subunit TsaD [Verrucomicrobiota bacterium]
MTSSAPVVLAIESSCDETAVSIVAGQGEVLASRISSQIDLHRPYGGVVPEVASRNHNVVLRPLLESALKSAGISIEQIDAFAATAGPGLASSLLIGNTTAKSLALASKKPFYSINHLEGHLLSPFMESSLEIPPSLGLVVSGGHTMLVDVKGFDDYRLLGKTRDDAAGEAFDKGAKMLGLPYPGGPEIDNLAKAGNPNAFQFPRSMQEPGNLEFSFSGLKTSLLYQLEKLTKKERQDLLADLCASFQAAIIDVLVSKAIAAAKASGRDLVAVSGGVSCNSSLRTALTVAADTENLQLKIAPAELCTDNASMIGFVGLLKLQNGSAPSPLDQDIDPNLAL